MQSLSSVYIFVVKAKGSSALASRSPYLAEVPRARTDLLLRAVVDPPRVVEDVLLPLVLVIQKHCVLCRDITASRLSDRHLCSNVFLCFNTTTTRLSLSRPNVQLKGGLILCNLISITSKDFASSSCVRGLEFSFLDSEQ